jgi:hypothetical protein
MIKIVSMVAVLAAFSVPAWAQQTPQYEVKTPAPLSQNVLATLMKLQALQKQNQPAALPVSANADTWYVAMGNACSTLSSVSGGAQQTPDQVEEFLNQEGAPPTVRIKTLADGVTKIVLITAQLPTSSTESVFPLSNTMDGCQVLLKAGEQGG